ncbi:MAG: GGDEF domain-containing protein [Desulfobacteria bacterium]
MEPEREVRHTADTALIRSVAERLAKSRGGEEGLADILPLLTRFLGSDLGAFLVRCEQAETDRDRLFRANEELGCLLRFNESLHANGDADSMFKWLSREIERFVPVLGIEMVSLIGKSVVRIGSASGTKVPAGEKRRVVSRKCSETLASRYRIHAPADGFKVKRFECLAASDSDRPGTSRRRVETPLLHAGQVVGFLAVEMPDTLQDGLFIDRLIASAAGPIGLFLHKNADREKIRSLADRDALTGLFNYRSFQEIFDREFERFCRHGRNMSLMMIDLDNFKRINDTFGHQAGDHALREVARILRANLRKTDYAFRYGGDEFVLLMAETDAEMAAVFAQRIRAAVKREVRCEFSFSTSIGIADCNRLASGDRGELLLLADAALYLAKNGGRDRIQVAPERLACAVGNVMSPAPRFHRPAVAEVSVIRGAV